MGRFLAMRHGEQELDRMEQAAMEVDEDTDRIFGTAMGWDREVVFVDDGLGDEFEEEAEQWERRRD